MLSRLPRGWGAVRATTWLAWLLPVFAWAPLTYPGYFEFLHGFAPIYNLADFMQHVTPGWSPPVGQGYDLLRGEGSLPYLLAALPHAAGLPGAASIKLVFGLALVTAAVAVYGWARPRLSSWPALVAAAVYVFWPFGLATIYVRGAFADGALLALLPLTWWAADRARVHGGVAAALLALSLTATFATQAGLATWLAVATLAYLIIHRPRYPLAPALAGWVAGCLLGALLLLPRALAHGGIGGSSYVQFDDHFVYPHQLFAASWGLGPSIAGPYDLLPFGLGLAACGLAATGVMLKLAGQADSRDAADAARTRVSYFGLAATLIPAALCLTLAAPLWRLLPFAARTLTYPWQLLLLAGPWLAWLGGLGARRLLGLWSAPDPAMPKMSRKGAPAQIVFASALPLFAALIALPLLGVYADLNPPAVAAPADRPVAVFGDNQFALVSAVVSPTVAGRTTVTVQWQALRPSNDDYTVFFHAEARDGSLWGQQDTMPQGGKAPTSSWRPGALVGDQYTLELKPGAPADLRYVLGLYQWQTGQRLPMATGDKVILAGDGK